MQYINVVTGDLYTNIWGLLEMGAWKTVIPENHESNVIYGLLERNSWKPVIKDIMPLFPGMKWQHTVSYTHLTLPTIYSV